MTPETDFHAFSIPNRSESKQFSKLVRWNSHRSQTTILLIKQIITHPCSADVSLRAAIRVDQHALEKPEIGFVQAIHLAA
ncbi:unnamed protein product [Dovyalis caffra]|uniref:Uncharacterized protein n=1 Tax=Dovyalis caffra TaxID=77055 RepID=A0AAV1QYV0_9ROSI|nr:unnamed protein product [Dovyalis caffra]